MYTCLTISRAQLYIRTRRDLRPVHDHDEESPKGALNEYLDDCPNTPLDINVEGDAFASEDEEDHSADVILNCVAWD